MALIRRNTSNIPSTKSHIHFLSLRSFIQGIRPYPRLLVIFRNKLIFYGEEMLTPRPIPKLENHPLSAVRDCLFNIVTDLINASPGNSFVNTNTGNNRGPRQERVRRYKKSVSGQRSGKHKPTTMGDGCFPWGPCKELS
jgi:hypothetical protein